MAARLGRTRLLDNLAAIPPGPTDAEPAGAPGVSADPATPRLED